MSVDGRLVWSCFVRNLVLGLPSTLVTVVLRGVDFSVSSFDLDTDGNIDGDISMVSFVKRF